MTTDDVPRMSPQELIDRAPMSRRQRLIVALGLLMMVAEGLDTTVASFVYPRIVKDWGTDMDTVTATVTMGVLAMIIGGVVAGPLADRYGRKNVTIVGTIAFGLGTIGMGLSQGIVVFTGLRIVACLGLGAVMPTVMALVADWTPVRRRVQMVALAFAGVTAGTTTGGILASALVPAFGWPVLLMVAGVAPLLLVPAVARFVPESLGVLASRRRPTSELRAAVTSVLPQENLSVVDWEQTAVKRHRRPAPRIILGREFLPTTLLVWLGFFLVQGVVFLILSYLPLLVEREGMTSGQAAVAVAAFGWGGLTGQLSVSFALKRFDRFQVLALLWVLSAVGLGAAGLWAVQFAALLASAFVLGLCLPAAAAVLQAVAAVAYPSSARATGMSWANSMGKVGPVVTGVIGGAMVNAGWSLGTVLLALLVPVGLGLLTTVALRARSRGHRTETAVGPTTVAAVEPETNADARPVAALVSEQV
ncbi:4-hydroxybenzoate transporter PcaK [Streptomyces sp. YIM 130001]|uniref:MFS transporter n=1 Tax=Streptomyces sp. YIM 130001 TaxID=2259644 RepID=UPI000ECC6C38|nr:MFS transporter [Streptomyces sp. YIM 130001]RII13462.1 4-hydroxybenzoate transporter PcaK [Streptomyces sp. YIM 130001]